MYVGLDLSDRPYFQQAQETGRFVLSDFILSRPVPSPTVMAVYPVSAFSGVADAVVLATVNLDWMSKVMSNLGGRAGITAVLVDSAGTVLAAPADQHSAIGRPLDNMPLMSAIADKALRSDQDERLTLFPRRRRLPPRGELYPHRRHQCPPDRQHRRGQGVRGGQPRHPHRLSPARVRRACSCCSAR